MGGDYNREETSFVSPGIGQHEEEILFTACEVCGTKAKPRVETYGICSHRHRTPEGYLETHGVEAFWEAVVRDFGVGICLVNRLVVFECGKVCFRIAVEAVYDGLELRRGVCQIVVGDKYYVAECMADGIVAVVAQPDTVGPYYFYVWSV